jgi:hypothetical protein
MRVLISSPSLQCSKHPTAQSLYSQSPPSWPPGGLFLFFLPSALHLDRAGNPTRSTRSVASRQPDRYMLTAETDDGWRIGNSQGKALWLISNEVGGLTLMFLEHY